MKPALVISDADNVATALENLEPGAGIDLGGVAVTVRQAIPRGHKIARVAIAAGQPVVKYGSPIGRPLPISRRENTSTRTTWRASAGAAICPRPGQSPQVARLAEPPDENGTTPPGRVRPGEGRQHEWPSRLPRLPAQRRPVGVRNYVLVVPTVICSAVVCERIAAALPDRSSRCRIWQGVVSSGPTCG